MAPCAFVAAARRAARSRSIRAARVRRSRSLEDPTRRQSRRRNRVVCTNVRTPSPRQVRGRACFQPSHVRSTAEPAGVAVGDVDDRSRRLIATTALAQGSRAQEVLARFDVRSAPQARCCSRKPQRRHDVMVCRRCHSAAAPTATRAGCIDRRIADALLIRKKAVSDHPASVLCKLDARTAWAQSRSTDVPARPRSTPNAPGYGTAAAQQRKQRSRAIAFETDVARRPAALHSVTARRLTHPAWCRRRQRQMCSTTTIAWQL